MPKRPAKLSIYFTVAVSFAVVGVWIGIAQAREREFPQAAVDYFADMDDGVALTPDEVRGRNSWLMWTGGDQAFWDYLARRSFGAFDLLKVLDSRNRGKRFKYYGVMNDPGFKQASRPDKNGLWLDLPDGTQDGSYAVDYRERFPKAEFLRTYGYASGVVGLRLFSNPAFNASARARWDPKRFYNDPRYYRDPALVRPYRVGMACGFCHVGPHPLNPPADPEHPQWRNLSSNIGNQYLRPGRVFVLPGNEDNFLFQVVSSMPPGTVDTSALATDNLNNPRNINAIYDFATRIAVAQHEKLAGGNLDMPGTMPIMPVPHVLKDGADSIGVLGALARVYVSIGTYHEEWIKHFNLLLGGTRQTPISIAKARKDSLYFRATLDRLENIAKFFIAAAKPQPLARAPGGAQFLQDSPATVVRGQQVFAEKCASCHVSPNKMPPSPSGIQRYSKQWFDWMRSDGFKREMTSLVRKPDFLRDNYLATDQPYSDGKIGTNACAAVASNAVRGHIWDNFSSETYKHRRPAGIIGVLDPFTGEMNPYVLPAGGRGYLRAPSLISIWASAPYLHNNSVGEFTGDPSVAGRMKAFEDGITKLLWPHERRGAASIARTTQASWLYVDSSYLPKLLFLALKAKGFGMPGAPDALRIGPIPKGTPVNLLANIDLDLSLDPEDLANLVDVAVKLNAALNDIKNDKLDYAAATTRLKQVGPALLKLSKCPDFVEDHGHLFGAGLSDKDKDALIAYLKRL